MRLAGDTGLESLDEFHRVDLARESGFERLCDDILSDWADQRASSRQGGGS